MEQIPDIVRGRLQATARAGRHPDANQLTAFAERSLGDRESVQVLAHLAECRDCREIVSLMSPPFEEFQRGGQAAASGWLRWPVLRWGALAACFVVVGTAVTMHFRSLEQQVPSEGNVALAVPEKKAVPEQALYAKADNQPVELRRDMKAAPSQAKQPTKQMDKLGAMNGRLTVPAPARSSDTPAAPPTSQLASAAAPSSLSKTRELDDREEGRKDESERTANEIVTTEAMAPTPSEPALGKAKESAQKSARTKGEMAMGETAGFGAAQTENDAASRKAMFTPRWTLSSDGTLQRSLDTGKTWEKIHVADKTTFRALAAIGAEIWVGGMSGALYHSSDAGQHWSQVKPMVGDKSLTADIIGVEFVDTWHGRLTTTSDGTWTTADGGQSWEAK